VKAVSDNPLSPPYAEVAEALDRGQEFIITRNGVPVGELRPARRAFVGRAALAVALSGAPPIDAQRFRDDVDALLDQDVEPTA